MKKKLAIFTVLLLAMAVFAGILGYGMIYKIYKNERRTVQNLAGRVIPAYPDAENVFMDALSDSEKSGAENGAKILDRYGYNEGDAMILDAVYEPMVRKFVLILSLYIVIVALFGYGFLRITDQRQKEQEEIFLLFLDKCLSGNCGVESEEGRLKLNRLRNPLLEDALKKLGENLQMKREYMESEQDHTKTLVTDISHQLKTPVSALKTCFALCIETDNDEEREEFLNRCETQMDKLEMLVDSLLCISRLETGIINLRGENTTLTEIIVEAVNSIYAKALNKNIKIITEDFTDVVLNLDKKWTAEAIANILDNAVKYGYEGNHITIRAQKFYSFMRVEVEDRGIGIPKEEQTKIFQRFYRGRNDVVRNTEGSGVGLYLSRQILERQGGTISVRSAREKGCIFVIQLPL